MTLQWSWSKNSHSIQSEARPGKNACLSKMSLRPFRNGLEMKTILEHSNKCSKFSLSWPWEVITKDKSPWLILDFFFILQKIICASNSQQCEIKESNIYKVYTREWLLLLLLQQWKQLHREAADCSWAPHFHLLWRLNPINSRFCLPPTPPIFQSQGVPRVTSVTTRVSAAISELAAHCTKWQYV